MFYVGHGQECAIKKKSCIFKTICDLKINKGKDNKHYFVSVKKKKVKKIPCDILKLYLFLNSQKNQYGTKY